jgi:tetrapyrrole methylase family protein/MazG family protein
MPVDPQSLPAEPFARLEAVMRLLRSPQGCPWDREQDHRSLRPHLLEECWELLAVLDEPGGPEDERLLEELGDVLLQVVFHAQIASERGAFHLPRVADGLVAKLIRRHPHVFAGTEVTGSQEVLRNWEAIKRGETGDRAVSPPPLPALLEAGGVLAKAERAGFRWPGAKEARAKVLEEWAEVDEAVAAGGGEPLEREFGDLLLAVVTWGRGLEVDAESALRRAVGRFRRRYARMEAILAEAGHPPGTAPPQAQLNAWEQAHSSPSGSSGTG